jgi:hypothetical protein
MAAVLKGMLHKNVFHVFELFIKCFKNVFDVKDATLKKKKSVGPEESSDSE